MLNFGKWFRQYGESRVAVAQMRVTVDVDAETLVDALIRGTGVTEYSDMVDMPARKIDEIIRDTIGRRGTEDLWVWREQQISDYGDDTPTEDQVLDWARSQVRKIIVTGSSQYLPDWAK
jgi:hypothetical protein